MAPACVPAPAGPDPRNAGACSRNRDSLRPPTTRPPRTHPAATHYAHIHRAHAQAARGAPFRSSSPATQQQRFQILASCRRHCSSASSRAYSPPAKARRFRSTSSGRRSSSGSASSSAFQDVVRPAQQQQQRKFERLPRRRQGGLHSDGRQRVVSAQACARRRELDQLGYSSTW